MKTSQSQLTYAPMTPHYCGVDKFVQKKSFLLYFNFILDCLVLYTLLFQLVLVFSF